MTFKPLGLSTQAVKGRDPILEKDVRPIAAVTHWHRRRKMWEKPGRQRLK
jgi:hypothetical protein